MRFLANENFPAAAINALTDAGHDIVWVRTAAPGSDDGEVLARAIREKRVLITFDKDFGELALASGLPDECGVVLFRMPVPKAEEAGQILARRLETRADWPGHFSVIEPGRVRMRPLVNK